MNAWALAKDVQAMASDEDLPENVRTFAAGLAERYSYPVDSQIVSTDGTFVAQIAANDMYTVPNWSYLSFLRDALRNEE